MTAGRAGIDHEIAVHRRHLCTADHQAATAHLTDQVVEDPSRNTPEALGALLDEWSSRREA